MDVAPRVDAVQAALPEARRVDGDTDVRGIGAGPPRRAGDGTRHGPLLHAAQDLAGQGGVVVLLSDGRAADGPVPLDVPVRAVPVQAAHADAQVAAAHYVPPHCFARLSANISQDKPVCNSHHGCM